MNEIVKVNYCNSEIPTVSGRELHKALEINSNYTTWFKRMCEYGFTENVDFKTCFPNLESECYGGQNKIDHEITLDMAKEICMIQRTEKGRMCRQYFIEIDKAWNNPEAVLARALQITQNKLEIIQNENVILTKAIAEQKPKVEYHDNVLNNETLLTTTMIAKDLGFKSANKLNKILNDLGIIYKKGKQWLVYAKYDWLIKENYCDYVSFEDKNSNPLLKWSEKGRKWIIEKLKETKSNNYVIKNC